MANEPKLKNKRLSQNDREIILKFAKDQIVKSADTSALDVAYEAAADGIHAKILADNPAKDMAVLKRYGLADLDECIYVSTGSWNYERFKYRDGDARIILRAKRERGCRNHAILLDGEAEAAFNAYLAAQKAHKAEIERRLLDFKALIVGTQSFNTLAEAWPAVELLREAIVGTSTALSVLSTDVMDRLKSDPAYQVAEAA